MPPLTGFCVRPWLKTTPVYFELFWKAFKALAPPPSFLGQPICFVIIILRFFLQGEKNPFTTSHFSTATQPVSSGGGAVVEKEIWIH